MKSHQSTSNCFHNTYIYVSYRLAHFIKCFYFIKQKHLINEACQPICNHMRSSVAIDDSTITNMNRCVVDMHGCTLIHHWTHWVHWPNAHNMPPCKGIKGKRLRCKHCCGLLTQLAGSWKDYAKSLADHNSYSWNHT